jgi:nitronate monooxygenase
LKSFHIGDLLIPVPVIQGGMGIGISLSGLASAVANMGGVGVISTVGIGLLGSQKNGNYKNNNIDALKREIRRARELSKGIIGVNIMNAITDFAEMVRTSIDEGIDIIFSGAGLPLDLPKYLVNGSKTKLVPIVSSARAASVLCTKWMHNFNCLPDAFVVEGPKAGGHLGFKPDEIKHADFTLENLVDEVLEVTSQMEVLYQKKIPVIAAGGIYSGGDIYHIMKRGVSAVQMGTRFIATKECDASDEFKRALIDAKEDDIRIIHSPMGLPGRAIYNQFLEDAIAGKRKPHYCRNNCIKSCDPKTTSYCISNALLEACVGNLNDGFVFTGSNAYKVEFISTVPDVFKDLENEYHSTVMNETVQ